MIADPKTAAENWPCPIARTWGDKAVNANCRGTDCPVWRWVPLAADDSRFMEAVRKAQVSEANGGLGMPHKKAGAHVMAKRSDFGIPTKPERGYCGLGGEPKA